MTRKKNPATWPKQTGEIFSNIFKEIKKLTSTKENKKLKESVNELHKYLQDISELTITKYDITELIAYNIVTAPVIKALYKDYDFGSGNKITIMLKRIRKELVNFNIRDNLGPLNKFYQNVADYCETDITTIDKQHLLMTIIQNIITVCDKKTQERLGIVFTPIEVVDFLIHSADELTYEQFGRRLTDELVIYKDPFGGTGIFLARVLELDIIKDEDLERKYKHELKMNEVVPLSFYIASINIEETYRERRRKAGLTDIYEPFPGIRLCDTFLHDN